MNEKNEFVKKYLNAYNEMEEAATEKIKNYGKTLDVEEEMKKITMKEMGWTEWPALGSEEADEIENDVDDWKYNCMYWCVFTGKHGDVYDGYIKMVRWNEERNWIEVFFESYDGDISEWTPESYISYDRDAIYMTILHYID